MIISCDQWFSILIPGERDLQNIQQLNSCLYLNPGQPNEKKAQGWSAFHWVNGKALSNNVFHLSFKDDFYNAWEEDIAVVNIFFGKDTIMGEKNLIYRLSLDEIFL